VKQLLREALLELNQKTHRQIEKETAWKWAARACAAYLLVQNEDNLGIALDRFAEAEDYSREAVEHAATSAEEFLPQQVMEWMQSFATNARNSFLRKSEFS